MDFPTRRSPRAEICYGPPVADPLSEVIDTLGCNSLPELGGVFLVQPIACSFRPSNEGIPLIESSAYRPLGGKHWSPATS